MMDVLLRSWYAIWQSGWFHICAKPVRQIAQMSTSIKPSLLRQCFPVDLPGFNDTVEWDLCNPRFLRLAGQEEFLSWFRFLKGGNDQARGPQGLKIPGQRAVVDRRVDDLI